MILQFFFISKRIVVNVLTNIFLSTFLFQIFSELCFCMKVINKIVWLLMAALSSNGRLSVYWKVASYLGFVLASLVPTRNFTGMCSGLNQCRFGELFHPYV